MKSCCINRVGNLYVLSGLCGYSNFNPVEKAFVRYTNYPSMLLIPPEMLYQGKVTRQSAHTFSAIK